MKRRLDPFELRLFLVAAIAVVLLWSPWASAESEG
jgi:hypothetical protein